MGAKQILRIAKIKTIAQVMASAEHTFRERDTPNADPAKAAKNAHSVKNAAGVVEALEARLNTVKVRKNAVRCVEFLVTASPEFFTKRSGQTYFDDAKRWLEKSFGAENVISSHVHRDEKTPHAVFYVVPIDDREKLNARGFFGGRQKMTAMQDAFHAKVAKKYGLERGQRGSKAEHETIAEYYARVNAKVPPCPTRAGLLLMNEEERIDLMKTLHAQAAEALAKVDKLEDEREKHTARIGRLETMTTEQKEREAMTRKAVARLIKNTYSPADFAKAFSLELKGKADIFEALVKSGKAQNFAEAVAQVAVKMPPKGGHGWDELAAFTVDLEDKPEVKPAQVPQVAAKPRPRGFGR